MRRYLIILILPGLIFFGLFGSLSYYFEPIDGDLTRIGRYSEHDFGWNARQPAIDVLANGRASTKPDVLVLGDSFSATNIWQSILSQKTGNRIQSFDYQNVGCIDSWFKFALQHNTAKTLVIETVERNFLNRFSKTSSCNGSTPKPFEISPYKTRETRNKTPLEVHFFHNFMVAQNTIRMHSADRQRLGGAVINAPLIKSCAKFSNLRADRILYYPVDENKLNWTQGDVSQAINNVMAMQKTAREYGKILVFVLVPDKLTIYSQCIMLGTRSQFSLMPDVGTRLMEAGANMPELQETFRTAIQQIPDLYFPNNTHLSWAGYSLMATKIATKLPPKILDGH